jgi:hypothetical protein
MESFTPFIAEGKNPGLIIGRECSKHKEPRASGSAGAFHSGAAEDVKMLEGKTLFHTPTVQVADIGGGHDPDTCKILGRDMLLDLFKICFDCGRNVAGLRALRQMDCLRVWVQRAAAHAARRVSCRYC